VSVPPRPLVQRVVEQPLVGRLLAGRLVAGTRVQDGLRLAAELAAAGHPAALEHRPAGDGGAELDALVARVRVAGAPGDCELTVPVRRPAEARELAAATADAGLGVVFDGAPDVVDPLLADHPGARVVVRAGEPSAEARCRALAGRRVRLRAGSRSARLAFVRCVDVLMAGDGRPAVATADPRLIAITGERAAWHGRPPESWEHVMPWRVRTAEQQRLAAAGATVRVAVVSGPGAVGALVGTPGGSR
jgi:proline dehydrogenase